MKRDAYLLISKGVSQLNQDEWDMTRNIVDRLFKERTSKLQLESSKIQENLKEYFESQAKADTDLFAQNFRSHKG
ncbi:hypothetical protein B2D45_05900 [Lactobacillus hilgardii]